MDLRDQFSFRQKPTGLFKHLLRIPVHLYRARLGFLMGERFMLITHRGRTSGHLYETPVEVVEHDERSGEFIVCSGTGLHADWYENLLAEPALQIQVGNRHWKPTQRELSVEEAAQRFKDYEALHPKTAERLLKSMGRSYDGTDAGRIEMMKNMPMLAFSDEPAGP